MNAGGNVNTAKEVKVRAWVDYVIIMQSRTCRGMLDVRRTDRLTLGHACPTSSLPPSQKPPPTTPQQPSPPNIHITTNTNTPRHKPQVELDFWGKPLSAKEIRKKQRAAKAAEKEAAKVLAAAESK